MDRPQLHSTRIGNVGKGDPVYLERIDTGEYAVTKGQHSGVFGWTDDLARATTWDSHSAARFHACAMGYQLTTVFGTDVT